MGRLPRVNVPFGELFLTISVSSVCQGDVSLDTRASCQGDVSLDTRASRAQNNKSLPNYGRGLRLTLRRCPCQVGCQERAPRFRGALSRRGPRRAGRMRGERSARHGASGPTALDEFSWEIGVSCVERNVPMTQNSFLYDLSVDFTFSLPTTVESADGHCHRRLPR